MERTGCVSGKGKGLGSPYTALPDMMFGAGVVSNIGERIRQLKIKKVFLTTDPVMFSIGRADDVRKILESSGISTVIFSDVEPDPPIELIERAGKIYIDNGCDGIVGLVVEARWILPKLSGSG